MSEHLVTDRRELWKIEFGEGYAIPDAIAHHPDLVDISWHNDIDPSFALKGWEHDDTRDVRISIAHPDVTHREDLSIARLRVVNCALDGRVLFASEDLDHDFERALAVLKAHAPHDPGIVLETPDRDMTIGQLKDILSRTISVMDT